MLFADDIIVYTENAKESTCLQSEQISEFGKLTGDGYTHKENYFNITAINKQKIKSKRYHFQ